MRGRDQTSGSKGVSRARASRAGVGSRRRRDVGGGAPALDSGRGEGAGLDQLGHARLRLRPRQAEIVTEVGLGRDAEAGCRDQQQLALRLVLGRGRGVEDGLGQHPLGQVVVTLEADAMGGADAAGEEEVVERDLALAPVVPGVSGPAHRRGDLGGADRAPLAHRAQNRLEQLGLLRGQEAGRFLGELLCPRHPPAQQRLQLDRQQRSFVPPVLEQAAVAPGPRCGPAAVSACEARRSRVARG